MNTRYSNNLVDLSQTMNADLCNQSIEITDQDLKEAIMECLKEFEVVSGYSCGMKSKLGVGWIYTNQKVFLFKHIDHKKGFKKKTLCMEEFTGQELNYEDPLFFSLDLANPTEYVIIFTQTEMLFFRCFDTMGSVNEYFSQIDVDLNEGESILTASDQELTENGYKFVIMTNLKNFIMVNFMAEIKSDGTLNIENIYQQKFNYQEDEEKGSFGFNFLKRIFFSDEKKQSQELQRGKIISVCESSKYNCNKALDQRENDPLGFLYLADGKIGHFSFTIESNQFKKSTSQLMGSVFFVHEKELLALITVGTEKAVGTNLKEDECVFHIINLYATEINENFTDFFLLVFCKLETGKRVNGMQEELNYKSFIVLLNVRWNYSKQLKLLSSLLLKRINFNVENIDGKVDCFANNLYSVITLLGESNTNILFKCDTDLGNHVSKEIDDTILGLGSMLDLKNNLEQIIVYLSSGITILDSINLGELQQSRMDNQNMSALKTSFNRSCNIGRVDALGNTAYGQSLCDIAGSQLRFCQTNSESLTSTETHEKLVKSYESYIKEENKEGAVYQLKQLINKSTQGNFEVALQDLTYKILDEVNRNTVLATCFVQENLEQISRRGGKNYNDVISLELKRRDKKINKLIEFLSEAECLNMIPDEIKLNFVEVKEIVGFNTVLRNCQKLYCTSETDTLLLADNIFKSCVEICLKEWNVKISTSQGENIDKFFQNLTKNYLILEKLIGVVSNIVKMEGYEPIDKLDSLSIVSNLIIDSITKVQSVRSQYFEKLDISELRSNWWIHDHMLIQNNVLQLLELLRDQKQWDNNSAMDDDITKVYNECVTNFKTLCRIILVEYSYILYESSMNETLCESKNKIINMMQELGYFDELNDIALKTKDYDLICNLDFYHNYERDNLLELLETWTMINKQSVVNTMDIIPSTIELKLRPSKHTSFIEFWTDYVVKILRNNSDPSDISCVTATKSINKFLSSENTSSIHDTVKDLLLKKFPQLGNLLDDSFTNQSHHFGSRNVNQTIAPNIQQSSMAVLNILNSKCSASETEVTNFTENLLDLNRSNVSLEYITRSHYCSDLNEPPQNVMRKILDNNIDDSKDRVKQAISYLRSLRVVSNTECRTELFYLIVEFVNDCDSPKFNELQNELDHKRKNEIKKATQNYIFMNQLKEVCLNQNLGNYYDVAVQKGYSEINDARELIDND